MAKLYMFHPTRNRLIPLDAAMIALRDKIATEKGYVKRPCTYPRHPSMTPHPCWERLDETPGFLSLSHQVARRDLSTCVILSWPLAVDHVALTVDGGHRKPKVAAAAPGPAWPAWRDVCHEEPTEEGQYLVSIRYPGPPDAVGIGLSWWLPFLTTYPGGPSHWSIDGLDHPEWITHWMPLPEPPEH